MVHRARFTSVLAVCTIVLTAVAANAAAGGLDPSFSGDGKLTTPFGSPDQRAEGVVVLPDDRVVAVGSKTPLEGSSQFALARYLTNGALDTSFSGDGKVLTAFTEGNAVANDVALAGNGDLIVVGGVGGFPMRFAVARYNPNGSLDTTFSGDGRRTISFGGDIDRASGVAITPAGKIVVAGTSSHFGPNGSRIAVARLTATGALDTSFSGDGRVLTQVSDSSSVNDLAVVDGKVIVVGIGLVSEHTRFLVAQFTGAGELDAGFGGGDGWLTTKFGTDPDEIPGAYGVEIDTAGRLVVAGEVNLGLDTSDGDFAVVRYLSNGALDTSFSSDGKVTHDFGEFENAEDLALQQDGKIVLAGVSAGADQLQAVVRLNVGGGRDTTFSGDGLRLIDVAPTYEFEGAQDIAIDGDGKLVAVGYGLDFDADPQRSTFTALRILGS